MKYATLLSELIDKSRLTLQEISEKCEALGQNITISYLSKLKNGKMPPPSYKITAVLAKVLNIDPVTLFSASDVDSMDLKQSEIEEALSLVYPEMSQKDRLMTYLNSLVGAAQVKEDRAEYMVNNDTPDLVQIPILGTIKAGYDLLAEQNIEGYSVMPRSEVSDGEYFYLKVKGDSMSGDRIYEGDRVLVRRQDFVEDNDIAVVLINGDEATLKRVTPLGNDLVALLASNPTYPMKTYPIDQVQIQGIVTKVEFDIK